MEHTSFKIDPLKLLLVVLVFTITLTFLSSPCLLFSSSILWPTQLLTQRRGSGRPGFFWLYLAMNRCSALERNIPPLLASVCVYVCAPVCASVCVSVCVRLCLWLFLHTSSPIMHCWFWLSSTALENWVRTGRLPPHINHMFLHVQYSIPKPVFKGNNLEHTFHYCKLCLGRQLTIF